MNSGSKIIRELWDIYIPFLSVNDVLAVSSTNTEIHENAEKFGFNVFLESIGVKKIDKDNKEERGNVKSILSLLKRKTLKVKININDRTPGVGDTTIDFLLFTPALLDERV